MYVCLSVCVCVYVNSYRLKFIATCALCRTVGMTAHDPHDRHQVMLVRRIRRSLFSARLSGSLNISFLVGLVSDLRGSKQYPSAISLCNYYYLFIKLTSTTKSKHRLLICYYGKSWLIIDMLMSKQISLTSCIISSKFINSVRFFVISIIHYVII